MNIQMIGIDHSLAGVDIRQCFAFTRKEMAKAMEKIWQTEDISGLAMLSTCNRMELWLSLEDGAAPNLPELLCSLKSLDCREYGPYLVSRRQDEAIRHLFYLTAGLKSQIVGEDQILTQVKEAIAFAREQERTDHVLEVLFRMAVTAGKRVKTEVAMDKGNLSAAHEAIRFLKEQGRTLAGKKCLVVGNGEMGKLTAQALMEEGADVTVTIRQYRSGVVNIPVGARRMDYGERYDYIPACDYVFSATASPNQTITREGLEVCRNRSGRRGEQIYVDLAVPRDIEETVGRLEGILLYDIDTFHLSGQSEQMKRQYLQAEHILQEGIREFKDWQSSRKLIPCIRRIGEKSAADLCWRMGQDIRSLAITEEEKKHLEQQLARTAEKVVDKLMFTLRDQVDADMLKKCVEVWEQMD